MDSFTFEYLPWRGISKETMQFYGVKTKIDSTGKPVSLGFNYPDGSVKTRLIEEKSFYVTGTSKPCLFGRNLFDPLAHKSVVITEGELDALSCFQILGGVPAVSIRGASSGLRDCTGDHSWLRDFEEVYLALDNDAPGRETAGQIAKLFSSGRVKVLKFERRKDANEYLQAGEEIDFRNIYYSAKRYLPDNIRSSLADFKSILETKQEVGVPYFSFNPLTEMTYGLRRGEVTLVTAMEGVGKTEFLHTIQYGVLRDTDWKVGGLFLEESPERHLQALAGIHLKSPCHLPDSGKTVDQVYAAVNDLVQADDRLFMDTEFGGSDVERLLGTIRYLVAGCDCGLCIVDHISIACSALEGEEQRRALDLFFTKAETMVKELNFSLIVVSHVNDYGQTRGSRWGAKMADTWVHLDRDTENGSNVLDITVRKNRFAGRTGHAGSYEFNPLNRTYTLVASNDDDKNTEKETTVSQWAA